MSFLDLIKFFAATLFAAACCYGCAVGVFRGGLLLFGDSDLVRAIIGPLAVFAGLAGMIGIPGGLASLVIWIQKKRSNRSE